MNILFLGYWGANEGLSKSTIDPHLELLNGFEKIEKIVYCSIERTNESKFGQYPTKVEHVPLYSEPSTIPFYDKVNDFINFPKQLVTLCEQYNIEKLICRGAPAGALGYLVWKKNKVPYHVESYEPHADYMLESGVWGRFDPRYLLQKRWEKKQDRTAYALMPVSQNYKDRLIEKGVNPQKIDVIPCVIDAQKFAFNQEKRDSLRKELNISPETTVGIYVGKFGGIYLEELAFEIFESVALQYESFHMIILTPDQTDYAEARLYDSAIKKATIISVPHHEVPNYLSASDIAFATIKPSKSRKYCSAIKVGEYWANGLPVVITPEVGDDSNIIASEKVGWVIDPDNIPDKLTPISKTRNEISKLVEKYRSLQISQSVYEKWYSNKHSN